MIIRNKLGTFEFDDNVQLSHARLIAATVMGQYYNPKRGEPYLTDEESCYNFIRERCSAVLALIGFELVINENVLHDVSLTPATDLAETLIAMHEARVIKALKDAFPLGTWLVGPAAIA